MMRSLADKLSFGAAGACLATTLILLVGTAYGQQPPAQATNPAAAQAPVQSQDPAQQPKIAPPGEPDRGGFLDAFGHWIESSVNNWNSGLKGAADVAKDAAGVANDAAKGAGSVVTDTAGAVARIPGTRV